MAWRTRISSAFRSSESSETVESVKQLVQFGCLLHLIHEYGVDVTTCVGPSMQPTFNDVGDVVIMERLTPHLHRYTRGDVVIAKSPTNANQTVCKRIRALEGDMVTVPSDLAALMGGTADHKIRIPKGHVWLEGDNSLNSTDSRYYGPIPSALITGRVMLKIWPPLESGFVRCIPPALEATELCRNLDKNSEDHTFATRVQARLRRRAVVRYRDEDSHEESNEMETLPHVVDSAAAASVAAAAAAAAAASAAAAAASATAETTAPTIASAASIVVEDDSASTKKDALATEIKDLDASSTAYPYVRPLPLSGDQAVDENPGEDQQQDANTGQVEEEHSSVLAFLDAEATRGKGKACEPEFSIFHECVRRVQNDVRSDWASDCLSPLGPVLACATATTEVAGQYEDFLRDFPDYLSK